MRTRILIVFLFLRLFQEMNNCVIPEPADTKHVAYDLTGIRDKETQDRKSHLNKAKRMYEEGMF